MHCPNCKGGTLTATALEPELPAHKCGKCGGISIARAPYDTWRKQHQAENSKTAFEAALDVQEIPKAKVCPACGHFLFRYRAASGIGFLVDFCGACGGFWLDANEWETLKTNGLHDNLADIVTAQWQKDLRSKALHHAIDQSFQTRLGDGDYGRVKDFRTWLSKHPAKSEIIAYLGVDVAKVR
jgi:Zn-finger nucleic acid-binding protein